MADGRLNSRLREDLLEALHGADLLEPAPPRESVEEPIKKSIEESVEESVEETVTGTAPPHRRTSPGAQKTVKLYVAEEQEILREAYLPVLTEQPSLDVVGVSGDVSPDALVQAVAESKPDVLLLGVKQVNAGMADTLESLREAMPEMGLVLLFAHYDAQGIKALRKFSNGGSVGCAYLLKHTIDTPEQFTQVIEAVAQGRVIVDPTVMEGLVRPKEAGAAALPGLSPRETEVLSWIAKGYRNDTIARVLSRDLRTVERHINSIYGKLQMEDSSKDPRVNAALMYLNATGSLAPEQVFNE